MEVQASLLCRLLAAPNDAFLLNTEPFDMFQIRFISRCIVVLASLTLAVPMVRAQSAEASGAVPTASDKVQRKAESKARRAQKNAELSELKKHGYNAAGAQATYPQNVQNAESMRKPATVGGPASTP